MNHPPGGADVEGRGPCQPVNHGNRNVGNKHAKIISSETFFFSHPSRQVSYPPTMVQNNQESKLIRWLAHILTPSFASHCSLHSRALLHSLLRLLAHSRAGGEVSGFLLGHQAVVNHKAFQSGILPSRGRPLPSSRRFMLGMAQEFSVVDDSTRLVSGGSSPHTFVFSM